MAEPPVPAGPDPEAPVTDIDRTVVVRHIQQAVADDIVPFEEVDDRFAALYQAATRGELDAVIADLPVPPDPGPQPVAHPLPPTSFTLLGDIKVGGWIGVAGDLTYTTLLGDIVIDLSSADLPDNVTITSWSLLGDTTVILPDGVRASMSAFRLLGDEKTDLAPAWPNTPIVEVRARKLIGDARLVSFSRLRRSKLRKLWRNFRDG